jgi:prostaglandin-endoperoxide synthase 2
MSLVDLLLKLAAHTPIVGPDALDEVNRVAINYFAASTRPRPRPFSLWSASSVPNPAAPPPPLDGEYITDYTSWPGLTNKQYSARHLGPADASSSYMMSLPPDVFFDGSPGAPVGDVTSLFKRSGAMTPSRSSLLFMFFAQWFTDSLLRIDMVDRRKNTSNHDIDLCQIYGLTEEAGRMLRKNDGSGELRSQQLNIQGEDEEFPEYLCREIPPGSGQFFVRPEFELLRADYGLTADQFVDQYVLGPPPFPSRKGKREWLSS